MIEPNTRPTFTIFEPTTVSIPTATSPISEVPATTAISGSDVAAAAKVTPIKKIDTPLFLAKPPAPRTILSVATTNIKIPTIV
jgi:hypothetical protein